MKARIATVVAVLGLLSSPAWAQTAIQPGTIVSTFYGSGYALPSTSVSLYTVPGDRAARVTDIVATTFGSPSATVCYANMAIGNSTFFFKVPVDTTVVIPLQTGFGITANGTVTVEHTNCASGELWIQIRGFNFTIP